MDTPHSVFGADQALVDFDSAWRDWVAQPSRVSGASKATGHKPTPDLVDYFPSSPPPRDFVIELVKIDLEFRWRYAEQLAASEAVMGAQPVPLGSGGEQPSSMTIGSWRRCPRLEDYLAQFPILGDAGAVSNDLILHEFHIRCRFGMRPTIDEFATRFATRFTTDGGALRAELEAKLEARARRVGNVESGATPGTTDGSAGGLTDGSADASTDDSADGSTDASRAHYQKIKMLGEGMYGMVWLAEDRKLKRQVALKEPRASHASKSSGTETYLAEALKLASLNHPNIVRVHDYGVNQDGTCYIVSEFIDGVDLAAYLKKNKLSFAEAAELVASVADALQHAHDRDIVHNDIKPANILIDRQKRPRIVDFGMAMGEEDYGNRLGMVGTPAYMSPEQANPKTHLIDNRSDIFSLGVVLYELLTGVLPFQHKNPERVLEMIQNDEPRPPRQRNNAVPPELERICLRALKKKSDERFLKASDFAAALHEYLRATAPAPSPTLPTTAPVRSVPKGLKSFDEKDHNFFLHLLPGTRGPNGLPEPLTTWKVAVEETDPEMTFRVGLISGPSGCGKSSLMKAGLLPRLADHIIPVYVAATPDSTEQALRNKLRRNCGPLPPEASLIDSLHELLLGKGLPAGRKILLVLDQFEQWLYGNRCQPNTELAEVLRMCDGQRIQALLLVRDDFLFTASRLFKELELPLIQSGHQIVQGGHPIDSSFAVDLFDPPHAKKVLTELGRAEGRLPHEPNQLSSDQKAFIEQAIYELTEDNQVICVRIKLFAFMMKSREWIPETLEQLGGTAGVGEKFLEETFHGKYANPLHRTHQQAAQHVLRRLLPEKVMEIKGHVRSHADLLDASGYAKQPEAFARLLHILDSEMRLITPAGEEGQGESDDRDESAATALSATPAPPSASARFQLTHDFLVPSLRSWLDRKRRETTRGRAEVCLEERTASWITKKEYRQLPTLWEFLTIRFHTRSRRWSDTQRVMMAWALRFHAISAAVVTAVLVMLLFIGMVLNTSIRMQGLVGRLISAEPSELSSVIEELNKNPNAAARYLAPLLSPPTASLTPEDKRAQLHARIASVSRDPSLVEPLLEEMLAGRAIYYVLPIRQQLRASSATLSGRLQTLLRNESADSKRRFHAALALADYLPASDSKAWTDRDLKFVAEQLVASNTEFQPLLREALRPIHAKLLLPLDRIYRDSEATTAERVGAANAFADYAAKDPARLANLLIEGTPEQYSILYPLVEAGRSPAIIADMSRIASTLPADELGTEKRVEFGQRRANAAITLLRFGEREKTLAVFGMTDDPEALTQFIFRCPPRGVGVESLLDCLEIVSTAPPGRYAKESRYALLLALAEFRLSEVPENRRPSVLKQVRDWYANDPSSGVHGAANWLLRQWGENAYVKQIDETPLAQSKDREWFTLAVKVKPEAPSSTPITFYYTFVVFPAGEYTIGSPDDEPGHENDEIRLQVSLSRPFAILNREVTFAELIAFNRERYESYMTHAGRRVESTTAPAVAVDWYDAIQFCRWLVTKRDPPLTENSQGYTDPESEASGESEKVSEVSGAPLDRELDLSRLGFRLPTEAEWEIANRGGCRTTYGFGSDESLLEGYGWYLANSGAHLHTPFERRPSHRGLFDMHGNANEWVHDCYGDLGGRSMPDPLSALMGSERVYRGGSFAIGAVDNRSANRVSNAPSTRGYGLGFRLALSFVGVPGEPRGDKKD